MTKKDRQKTITDNSPQIITGLPKKSESSPIIEPVITQPDKAENKFDPTNIKSILCKPKIPLTIEETITVGLVQKPRKEHWFQVRPFDVVEPTNCWPVNIFEYEHAGELGKTAYFVDPESEVGKLLAMHGKLVPAILVLGIYFHGEVFVWCVKTPTGKNKSADKWATTRVKCAQLAQSRWVTIESNATGYFPRYPLSEIPAPTWEDYDADKLFGLACKEQIITSLDHEIIRLFLGRTGDDV
jgi:hypothetical protein